MWGRAVCYIDIRISGKLTAAILRIDNGVKTPYEYKIHTHIYLTTSAIRRKSVNVTGTSISTSNLTCVSVSPTCRKQSVLSCKIVVRTYEHTVVPVSTVSLQIMKSKLSSQEKKINF
jgi:hypothetical protein